MLLRHHANHMEKKKETELLPRIIIRNQFPGLKNLRVKGKAFNLAQENVKIK